MSRILRTVIADPRPGHIAELRLPADAIVLSAAPRPEGIALFFQTEARSGKDVVDERTKRFVVAATDEELPETVNPSQAQFLGTHTLQQGQTYSELHVFEVL